MPISVPSLAVIKFEVIENARGRTTNGRLWLKKLTEKGNYGAIKLLPIDDD